MTTAALALPRTPHFEKHFTAPATIRDVIIGMSDGLTVPFALAAGLTGGLSGTLASATHIVVTAGLAEIAAGSIAMGLGGYLAAKSDAEHYRNERRREEEEVLTKPEIEKQEVAAVFVRYGLTQEEAKPVVEALAQHPESWVDFMMQFELGLEKPDPSRARNSAITIALSYIAGGLIPLAPYMLCHQSTTALKYSVFVTIFALFLFGLIKGKFTGSHPVRSALQTTVVGGLAAAAAFALARIISPGA